METSSSSGTRQHMAGSLDRPVSMARMCGVKSPKHSSSESKPDLDPNIPNHGVQAWAGIIMQRGSISRIISSKSLGDMVSVGLPSPSSFAPLCFNASFILETLLSVGAKRSMCTLLERPRTLAVQFTSVPRMNFTPLYSYSPSSVSVVSLLFQRTIPAG